jgi:hypothetical protein
VAPPPLVTLKTTLFAVVAPSRPVWAALISDFVPSLADVNEYVTVLPT